MAKPTNLLTCTACGAVHRKWAGQYDACGGWNTIVEEAPLSTGRKSLADMFLIAIYIVVVKGAGMVTIETAWGLYLFTGCILASIWVAAASAPAKAA